jgi:hypothetical protein
MRTERRIADWQCNRCGNIEQTTVAVLRDEIGVIVSDLDEVPIAPLPNGWVKVTLAWNQGTELGADLCTSCAEKVDGFIQKRYDLAEQDNDVEPEPKKRAPRTAKTAKKAT